MINVQLWNEEDKKIGNQIMEFINDNIRGVIEVLIDIMQDDPYFEIAFLFTRDRYEREPDKCRNSIYELYELINSRVVRNYINPNYEFLLFNILRWWIEAHDEDEELICFPLSDELRNSINISNSCEDQTKAYVINTIEDFNEYVGIIFEDLDFLPDEVNRMTLLYIENPLLAKMVYHYDNLEDFFDLMECDIREIYLQHFKAYHPINEAQGIVEEILEALKQFQKRVVDFQQYDEVQVTATFHDTIIRPLNLKFNMQIAREFTMGRSAKKLGETDLYIYRMYEGQLEDFCVIENKYIEKFVDQYYQLMGYLNPNFKFGITLSINRNKPYRNASDYIMEKLTILKDKSEDFAPVYISRTEIDNQEVFVSKHIMPENGELMTVYHLIFNLYDEERYKAAKRARRTN
ncbi:hypothetical protein [Zhenhengia yiwuensis]|uniref:Uncharacterized protein n=1 Tax=Zhenhengia yiwuensis TaxID=2763666 RepID=A0A926EH51_9FIRM|nr:hypothetical protein [Zhenhengia yiwuensis]MBC8580183.1 hypothetical protein [Zhenhengia yiwuensis]